MPAKSVVGLRIDGIWLWNSDRHDAEKRSSKPVVGDRPCDSGILYV